MTEKLNIAVLYGGKSTEHEVSVHSAQTVCQMLQQSGTYQVTFIFINRQGRWFCKRPAARLRRRMWKSPR